MRQLGLIAIVIAWGLAPSAHAQLLGGGIVFDPTQSAHAIQQISEAQQMYTTAIQTRDQVIGAYNLARQMALMPQDLYRKYAAEFSQWTTLSAANTYGNTADWIAAANGGAYDRASSAVGLSGIPLQAFPDTTLNALDAASQNIVKTEVATAEIANGLSSNSLVTLGQIRARSQALNQQISRLQEDIYATNPDQQTEMAVLGKINTAGLMQLRSQQDTNQILSASALQQMITSKEQFDQQKRALNQAIYFQQNFQDVQGKVTSGMTQSMQSISFSAHSH